MADLPGALVIQSQAYPPFLVEAADVFASRINLPGSYCVAATRGDALVAYLLAHRWKRQEPPALGAILAGKPDGEVLFLHDLAASPTERGSGVGRELVMRAFDLAARDGIKEAELVAVQGATAYWRSLGFAEGDAPPELSAKIADYGSDARWMNRGIPQAKP